MPSQGPFLPGVAGNANPGAIAWSFVNNFLTDNDVSATVTLGASDSSKWLVGKNLGFSIPSGATIDGIVAELNDFEIGSGMGHQIALTKDSLTFHAKTAVSGLSWTAYGGVADLWDTTWTPAEINSAEFGICAKDTDVEGFGGINQEVDAGRVTVYYTEGAPVIYQERIGGFDPHMLIKAWF